MGFPPQGIAPVISSGDFFPPDDNLSDLGKPTNQWRNFYFGTAIVGGVVGGPWNPDTDDFYDLGENSTPLEWKDIYIDGIAYLDDMSVPNGFSIVSEVTAFSHFDHDNGAWDIFTKTSAAAQLSRLRIPSGTDSVDIALANANLLFGSGFGIRANAANGTIVDFEAYENGAYVTLLNMNSSATTANFTVHRSMIFDDDISLKLGTGGPALLQWNTKDDNAHVAMLILPESGDPDVPVLVIGDTTVDKDLTVFNGIPGPAIAVFNGAATQRVVMGNSIGVSSVVATDDFYLRSTSGSIYFQPFGTAAITGRISSVNSVITLFGDPYLRIGDASTTTLGTPTEDDLHCSARASFGSYTHTISYHELSEMAAPGQGAANTARIYAFEGGGDALTDLAAVFQDGTVDVFAQESTDPDSPIFQFPDDTLLALTLRKPDRKTIQFVATFPDGREFVMRELRYPNERWN